VVLGGDKSVGVPRAVAHAWQLRELIRRRDPAIALGGWANPHADPVAQAGYLAARDFHAGFYLTQVVSHHGVDKVGRFIDETARAGIDLPGVFGVFFYRSANPRTLTALGRFLPVPVEGLTNEFAGGATPEEVCARSIRALRGVGARHFYLSNLPIRRAPATLRSILELAQGNSGT
jgi:hypothetical protein